MTATSSQTASSPAQSAADQILLSVERTRALLQRGYSQEPPSDGTTPPAAPQSPLQRLAVRFALSPFETDALTLCAAVELDPQLPAVLEAFSYTQGLRCPNFQLLLNVFPNSHWSALMPQAPLRRWRLLEVLRGDALTSAPLRIDENVLHFLMGGHAIDEHLEDFLHLVEMPPILPQSYRAGAERIVQFWSTRESHRSPIYLLGNARDGKAALAATASAAFGLGLRRLSANSLPEPPTECEAFLRLLERDSALNEYAILVDAEHADPSSFAAVRYLAERFQGFLVIAASSSFAAKAGSGVTVTVDKPSFEEQSALWHFALGKHAAKLNGDLDRLSRQFSLDFGVILTSAENVLREFHSSGGNLSSLLWNACRAESRPALQPLAMRIEPRARWSDIVLPEGCLESLRAIVFQMRLRSTVLAQWGFAAQTTRGLGTAALFCGPSGTGKTLAAEILANELCLDLFHIDLSQIVSKYIGETEKNLRTIFDAAEDTGAILLFDEADALFGKRSEVRDSHDRYANIEVSYLLQRMEAYRGLAILTTNQRASLDSAFLRRIRFVVHFPYPDASHRRLIWQRIFPPDTPTVSLDFDKLARLNLPGGNIRNIALNAAYIACEKGEPVRMGHLLAAARQECTKLERPWNDAELGGWA